MRRETQDGPGHPQQRRAALEHSAGYLRSELGRNLQMFTTPQLVFVYDESIERGMRMDQLLAQVAREDAAVSMVR